MSDSPLLNSLVQVIEDYERNFQQKLLDAEDTIDRLKKENAELRQELDSGSTILEDVTDEVLKKRLTSLGTAPLDTLVREAGVVLEEMTCVAC